MSGFYQHLKSMLKLSQFLKYSSSAFAVGGGIILAANVSASKYGFILLACSSFQMLISGLLAKDISLSVYSGSLFIFVDLLGIYRWVVNQ